MIMLFRIGHEVVFCKINNNNKKLRLAHSSRGTVVDHKKKKNKVSWRNETSKAVSIRLIAQKPRESCVRDLVF